MTHDKWRLTLTHDNTCPMTLDTLYMTHDTWPMTLDTWHWIHDTLHMTLDTWHLTHDTWHMTLYTWHMTLNEWHFTHDTRYMKLDTAGFEEFSNIRMGAIAQTKFLSNGNQMHQLQQKITSRQQFVDWTTWPCLKKVFLHFVWLKNTHLSTLRSASKGWPSSLGWLTGDT